jgi:hypothetical protein
VALRRVAGNNRRAAVATGPNRRSRIQPQAGLLFQCTMAGKTLLRQDRFHLAQIVHLVSREYVR